MKRKILNIIKIVVLLSVFFGTLNISNTTFATDANQTLEDGVYTIKSAQTRNLCLIFTAV